MKIENFRTLYIDPGEDTGWCIASGEALLSAGTEKMWSFAHEVWADLNKQPAITNNSIFLRQSALEYEWALSSSIGRIVCEDWRLYPHKMKLLAWDQCRTARIIGALTFMAQAKGIDFILQPAKIKESAIAGGAEAYFYSPRHENRHQNDSIMHFQYFTQVEFHGAASLNPSEVNNDD